MKTGEAISELTHFFSESGTTFMLSGGILAGAHRAEPRASGIAEISLKDRSKVLSWITSKGLNAKGLRFPRGGSDLTEPIEQAAVISTEANNSTSIGFDFVFDNPFFELACSRVPKMHLKIEGQSVPAFDAESYFIYRLYLLGLDSQRYLDQDDLHQMAARKDFLQWPFIVSELERRRFHVPSNLNFLPIESRRLLQGLGLQNRKLPENHFP